MREFLKPVVKASRDLSRKGNINSPVLARQIVGEMYDGLGLDRPDAAATDSREVPIERPDTRRGPAKKRELPKLRVDLESLCSRTAVSFPFPSWRRSCRLADTPFDFLLDTAGMALLAVLNTSHPLFLKTKDMEQLRILAIADSILRFLVDECGMSGRKAAEVRSAWILTRTAGARRGGAHVTSPADIECYLEHGPRRGPAGGMEHP